MKKNHLTIWKAVIIGVFAAFVSLLMLTGNTVTWFTAHKIPNATDLEIDNPTARVTVERFFSDSSSYSLLYAEPFENLTNAVVPLDIPEMTFYQWQGEVLSTLTEELFYKITVTSRFATAHFSTTPVVYMIPQVTVSATDPLLESIYILKAEYQVQPGLGLGPGAFPNTSFTELQLGLEEPLLFPQVGPVTVGGGEYFQSVFYIMITPNTEAVDSVINSLTQSLDPHQVRDTLLLAFGFRSAPFYTPP